MVSRKRGHDESQNGTQNGTAHTNGAKPTKSAKTTNATDATNGQKPKKQLILNAFSMNCPAHIAPGMWSHPRNKSADYTKLSFWTDLAQKLDKANFHALFLADILGHMDVYKGPGNIGPNAASGAQFPVNDPLYLVPAMAAATKNLAFGITASTTYDPPYSHARRFSTVDHYSNGRIAWNIVTSFLDSAARNLGVGVQQMDHDERYEKADEFMEVLYKLWEGSFQDGAVVKDKVNKQYAIADHIRRINHEGKYFTVPGPHMCEPSPQRTPLLFQAGASKAGKEFGAKHAEALFISQQTPEKAKIAVDDFRRLAKEKYGRAPTHIKAIGGVTIVVAATDEEAQVKDEEFFSYGDREGALALFGGWTGIDLSTYSDDEDFRFAKLPAIQSIVDSWSKTVPGSGGKKWTKSTIAEYIMGGGTGSRIVGSPTTVVDELERWVEVAGLDGFNLSQLVNPGSFEDIIEFVLPELQRRGLFRTKVEKEGATARETYFGAEAADGWLLPDHPGRKFRWEAGKEAPVYLANSCK